MPEKHSLVSFIHIYEDLGMYGYIFYGKNS